MDGKMNNTMDVTEFHDKMKSVPKYDKLAMSRGWIIALAKKE
jgi:hypothetical protein